MTLNELRIAVRSNLDDTFGSLFTDDQLRLKINSAMRHIWNELNKRGKYFNTITETISFTPDNQEVAIAGDIHTLIWVRDTDRLSIDVVDDSQAQRTDKQSVYITRTISSVGNSRTRVTKLGYYRIPDIAFDLTIKYNQQITVFSGSANGSESYEDIPKEHHNVIVLYATILSLPKYHESIADWQQLFNVEMLNLIDSQETYNIHDMAVVDVYNAYNYA